MGLKVNRTGTKPHVERGTDGTRAAFKPVSLSTAAALNASTLAAKEAAEDARDEAVNISGLVTTDDVMRTVDADPDSDFRQQQDERLLASIGATAIAVQGQYELQPYVAEGDSWTASTVHSTPAARTVDRVGSQLRTATPTNRGVSSRTVADVANLCLSGVGGWTARTRALVTLTSAMLNDLSNWGTIAAAQRTYQYALRTFLSVHTCNNAIAANVAPYVYSANWVKESIAAVTSSTAQAAAATKNMTGTARMRTTTTGSYYLISVPSDVVHLRHLAEVGGGGLATITNNATSATIGTFDLTAAVSQEVVATKILTGVGGSSGSPVTLRVTLTSGTAMVVDSHAVPLTYPVPIIIAPAPDVPAGGAGNTLPGGDPAASYQAAQAIVRGWIATVIADFGTAVIADLNAAGFAAAEFDSDKRHLNDRGARLAASVIVAKALDLGYNRGMNVLDSADVPIAYVPPTAPATPGGGVAGSTLPGNVLDLVTSPDDTTMGLSWSAPRDAGSTSITDYLIEYKLHSSGSWSTYSHTASTATSITITGLTNGSSYDFRVSPINSGGTGSASAVATASPVATPIIALADDFNRANSTTSAGSTSTGGRAWVPNGAMVWGITGNALYKASDSVVRGALGVNCGSGDGKVQATLKNADSGYSGGLAFRIIDGSNFYILSIRQTASVFYYTLFKNVAGVVTSLGTTTQTPLNGDVMRVELSGTSIVCKVNGASIISITDSALSASTRNHGFYSTNTSGASGTTFDDFSYTP